MIDPWFITLVAILPLLWTSEAKMRSWAGLGFAALMGQLLPPLSAGGYIFVDGLAAWMILRSPAGVAQRTIGALFALMVLYHVGWIAGGRGNHETYLGSQYAVGWIQLVCLGTWGVADLVGLALGRFRPPHRARPDPARV